MPPHMLPRRRRCCRFSLSFFLRFFHIDIVTSAGYAILFRYILPLRDYD